MPLQTSRLRTEVVILGSGFAGSLLALLLNKIGRKAIIIDKARHPRFAIGESSTPMANMILGALANRYNLPALTPLTTFGTWRDTYPHLVNGRKRGFSYFQHEKDEPFKPANNHSNELLVTASTDNYRCDTHWLRADIDHFLFQEVQKAGVQVFDNTLVQALSTDPSNADTWQVQAQNNEQELSIEAAFVIDATGEAGLVARHLDLPDLTDQLQTHSHAIFSHFVGLPTWHDFSTALGADTTDYPFFCDDAAVHQCIDHGWMWMLRFIDGRVSAGFALDCTQYRPNYSVQPESDWASLIAHYPTLQHLFSKAKLAETPGKLYRTGRLQRLWGKTAGKNWALLPHTAGFIDPMHSTGIAHSLSGIEQLVSIMEMYWGSDKLELALQQYNNRLIRELKFIDLLVAGCYPCMGNFDLLTSYTMLYFAAAITYEERRMG
ncbi:MAG: tryptophan 7-halogenase [Myxococcota bacterium]